MTRELLLLRHGKSDWSTGRDDSKQPLKKRGKLAAQRMGACLAQEGQVPEAVVTSPATRALATAEKCVKAMGLTSDAVVTEAGLYQSDPATLLAVIADTPANVQRLMLVGHNPALEQLLDLLLPEAPVTPPDGKLLPTASLARLTVAGSWSALTPGGARLSEIRRAKALPEGFPYPFPDGAERRERPAYYYTQSAVVPYRWRAGQLQILLIGSSSNRHWSLPKGIAEPGLSLAASAQKEALEEAGVEGDIEMPPLGAYRYKKWGAHCEVTVFPLRVTREHEAATLEEPHRARHWMTIERAVGQLHQPRLGALVRSLAQRLEAS